MDELIGKECAMEFTLPDNQWPIPGWPAWVIVDAVALPMLKIRSKWAGEPMWVNTSIIQRIWQVRDNPDSIPEGAEPHPEVCVHQWSTRGPHAEPGRCMKCGCEP